MISMNCRLHACTKAITPDSVPVVGMNFTQKMLALCPVSYLTTGWLLPRSHRQTCRSSEPLHSNAPACMTR